MPTSLFGTLPSSTLIHSHTFHALHSLCSALTHSHVHTPTPSLTCLPRTNRVVWFSSFHVIHNVPSRIHLARLLKSRDATPTIWYKTTRSAPLRDVSSPRWPLPANVAIQGEKLPQSPPQGPCSRATQTPTHHTVQCNGCTPPR